MGKFHEQKNTAGFSTIELLIAFSILTLSLTAVILMVFGNQTFALDSEFDNHAIYKAGTDIEEAYGMARSNFLMLVNAASVDAEGYSHTREVTDLTPCVKHVTAEVGWTAEFNRLQNVMLGTIFTSTTTAAALGMDCDTTPPSEWENPSSATTAEIGGQGATDIDANNDFLYITSDPSAPGKKDFFIYEFDSSTVTLTERGNLDTSDGLNALDMQSGYAYVANNDTESQLMVIDIGDSLDPEVGAPTTLPETTTGVPRSIFYYDEYVYLGTQYQPCPPSCTPAQNNEFHIYDVSDPTDPEWRGSYNVNHNINDIVIRDGYAYLATSDNDGEIHIYDVSDPTSISFVASFNANRTGTDTEDATALFLLGNRLYFGREQTSGSKRDFYMLDVTDPGAPVELGSKKLSLNPGALVKGIVVRGSLAFVALDNPTS